MLPDLLRVELTRPEDAAREAEFNTWYSGNRVPDLLNTPGWIGASRYRLADAPTGDIAPYLALYYIEGSDPRAAEAALTERLTKNNPWRIPAPPPSGDRHADLMAVDTVAYYRKMLEVGSNQVLAGDPPPAIMVTLTFPARGTPVVEMNEWYSAHVGDIITTDGFRGAARYELTQQVTGHTSAYIAIYELETDDVQQVARNLAENRKRWLSGDSSSRYYGSTGPMPNTPFGERWVGVDGFAYFILVDTPTATPTLVP